ncbi:NAD/NADP octopine/nopaline dehydrogenase family protein [Ottowia thiooxydans]|uniref:NAD/NADP octopine/nopaline dehydrogenase family protein n=1 Tax=Ottowia thiooxydans TaxID=219182 RepID=UPI00041C23EE|nr:NAD/NADP octopine/nopaline dehydrogenase family protein [Ottowia thiooxydans]
MTKVAVIGNTHRNLGVACAADLALAGHEVRYAPLSGPSMQLDELRASGGFELKGDPSVYYSGKIGKAPLHAICDTAAQALDGAEVVLLDVPMPELENRFGELIQDLPHGAVVHIQGHGYWSAARVRPLLRKANREDVIATDAGVPTHVAALDGVVVTGRCRRSVEFATVPGHRITEALAKLKPLFGDALAAPSALQTGLENLNLMVHPAMVLLGIGMIERADLRGGEHVRFYRECNVPSAGKLADALDVERGAVCKAYGVRHRTLPTAIDHYYGTPGKNAYEAVLHCDAMQAWGAYPATTWRGWESVDVPYAIVPLVWLAEQAGLSAPLHRGVADILGVLLGIDPWSAGPTLADMNLDGELTDVVRYFSGSD